MHAALNPWYRKDRIVLRPGLALAIEPASRHPFEFFCFRDTDMVQEFDNFLLLMQHRVRLLDVGALHGIFSLAFTQGRSGARALAIEPSPLAFPRLENNIRRNPGCSVRAIRTALSDHAGTLPMYAEWEHVKVAGDTVQPRVHLLPIPALTGDEICTAEQFEPDIIKIDVEGYEWQCLAGLEQVICTRHPLVFLEVHPAMMKDYGRSPADLADYFLQRGYRFMDHERSPLPMEKVRTLTAITRIIATPEMGQVSHP